jgi:hypothetical protein
MSLKDQMTPEEIRRLMRLKAQRMIDEHGCMITAVFPTAESLARGEGLKVCFAYTIGLPVTFPGAPELLMIGLDPDSMHAILNNAAALMKEGKRFADGDEVSGLIKNWSLAFRTVPKHRYEAFVGQALNYYDHDDFGLLQVIWPDTKGRFPWQERFEERFREKQPLLFERKS